jgi:hypothetical protein
MPNSRSIFLSASVPARQRSEKYQRVPDADIYIDEAVTALARAVLHYEGQLILGGHPAISPLVATVASDYWKPPSAKESAVLSQKRPDVIIYQSRAFTGFLPDETLLLFRMGYAEIRWVEAVSGERFNPEIPDSVLQCANSLDEMYRTMIRDTDPLAMVCIGGMEGVEREFELFRIRYPERPIYVFQTTGGACSLIAERYADMVRVPDINVIKTLGLDADDTFPYPLISQLIVNELFSERRL